MKYTDGVFPSAFHSSLVQMSQSPTNLPMECSRRHFTVAWWKCHNHR
jgi:hypothetical protein